MVDPEGLLLLIAANGAPVLAALLLGPRWVWPVDAGCRFFDGHRLLGAHKTWRGLVAGSLAAALAGGMMDAGFALGAGFGALALGGDLLSSFAKRRLDRPPGRGTPLLDQLPESLAPLLVLSAPLGLDASAVLGTTLVFTVLDLLASRTLRALRARRG